MVKIKHLKLVQLKAELEIRGLRTSGSKAELFNRLLQALTDAGVNPDDFEFDVASTSSADSEENMQAGDESPRNENIRVERGSDADSDILTAIQALAARQEVQIQRLVNQQDERFSRLTTRLEESFSAKTNEVELRVSQLESHIYGEMESLTQRVQNLCRSSGEMGATSIATGPKLTAPVYDGTSEFAVFKIQFEAIAHRNKWNDMDKAMVLMLSLRGNAANVLQSIPESGRYSFITVMSALQRRFGSEHSKQLLRIQLKSRVQKKDESLQEYALDIERLAQIVFSDFPENILEMHKVQIFIDGVRDLEIKKQLIVDPKGSLTETLGYALLLESASFACGSMSKVRCVERKDENLAEVVCQAVKAALQPERTKKTFSGRCYKCNQLGHMARDCHVRRGDKQQQVRQMVAEGELFSDEAALLN